jgi:hypothetical protein
LGQKIGGATKGGRPRFIASPRHLLRHLLCHVCGHCAQLASAIAAALPGILPVTAAAGRVLRRVWGDVAVCGCCVGAAHCVAVVLEVWALVAPQHSQWRPLWVLLLAAVGAGAVAISCSVTDKG